MQYLIYDQLNTTQLKALYRRPAAVEQQNIASRVAQIETRIQQHGATALEELSSELDGVPLKKQNLEVPCEAWAEAWHSLEPPLQNALQTALQNIAKFHNSELPRRREATVETSPGIRCWREFRPIDSVGLYIPGGSAPLFSSILMLGIPAIIAACPTITFCSPPSKKELGHGGIYAAPEMLGCMHLLSQFAEQMSQQAARQAAHGQESSSPQSSKFPKIPKLRYFQIGGAQAIFAMAQKAMPQTSPSPKEASNDCGLPSIHKIFGPGNSYVTEAKLRVSRHLGIDMPAGPSEVLIIAEKGQNPAIIAADLLAQAEHGPSSQVLLLSPDAGLLRSTEQAIAIQLAQLKRSQELQATLANSYLIETSSVEQALDFSNNYAPEHLILALAKPEPLLPLVRNAGSVFCGPHASESFGDYASGTNHTLPTAGFARSHSGVNTESFGRWLSFQSVDSQGLESLGPTVELLAQAEQLEAHKNAVTQRRLAKNETP